LSSNILIAQHALSICDLMLNWFPDSEIMNCFSIFDPNGNVHDDQQALDRLLQHFGDPKKDNLGETHAPIVDKIKSLVEYSVLKDVLKRSELSMQEFYRKIVHTNMDMYPNKNVSFLVTQVWKASSKLNSDNGGPSMVRIANSST
jgi:hypothetical protein